MVTEDQKTNRTRKIREMAAYLDALSGDHDASVIAVEGTDDDSIRHRLTILLNSKRFDQAAEFSRGIAVDEKWCDLAVKALAYAGDFVGAKKLLNEVRRKFGSDHEPMRLRCIWNYTSACFEHIFSNRSGKYILPGTLGVSELQALEEILSTLSEVEHRLIRDGVIKTKLEMYLAALARKVHILLGNDEEHIQLVRLLLSYSPVPVDVSQDIRNDLIPCPENLPERLRRDHGENTQALLDACILEAEKLNRPYEALTHALDLVQKVKGEEEKRFVAEFLFQLSAPMVARERDRAMNAVKKLLGEDSREYAVIQIESLVQQERYTEALLQLEEHQDTDDPIWLQVYGYALLGIGREKDAAEAFFTASQKLVHPDVLRRAGDLSLRTEDWNHAKESFQKILTLNPDDPQALHNLGSINAQLGDYDKACGYFAKLSIVEPDTVAHKVNLAVCQKECGALEDSLATYESIDTEHPELPVLLGKAEVLRGLGKVDLAFKNLVSQKQTFWSDPAFVAYFMNLAFAAGEEELAHKAMQAMINFRQIGEIDEKEFRAVHSDEAIELIKEAVNETEQQRQHLYREMLQGRMPWIWASNIEGDAVYWAWRMRTQELGWYGDDPVNRARYCIYATNGFHARKIDEKTLLMSLEASQAEAEVVADLSALITLHRLGLLDEAIEYFGKILIPQGYLQTILEDGRKMVFHQRSRKHSAENITRLISTGTLQTIAPTSGGYDELPWVEEHIQDDEKSYPLIDFLQPVYDAGLVEDAAYDRVKQICHRTSIEDEHHPKLSRLQSIRVGLSTLETLSTFGLLVTVADYYRIHLLDSEHKELTGRLQAIRTQEETRQRHFEMWDALRENDKVRFVPHAIPPDMLEKGMEPKELLAFLSVFVAREQKVPLMADERVCQAFFMNVSGQPSATAFGTDAVIRALVANRRIDEAKGGEAFLTLVRWRYRFLVPPSAMLKTLALRFKGRLPGKPLREIAEYLHDCMRDVGLFGGPENTTPPVSMAAQFYLTWLQVIADFLVEVWLEDEFEPSAKDTLTRWCVREFLPSLPQVMQGGQKTTIADSSNRLLISYMLINVRLVSGGKSASEALRAVQAALHLSNEDYLRIVTEVLNDAERTKA